MNEEGQMTKFAERNPSIFGLYHSTVISSFVIRASSLAFEMCRLRPFPVQQLKGSVHASLAPQ
jgi:hypothetical protein